MQQVVLPSLWPRMKNTRGPMGGEEGGDMAGDVTMMGDKPPDEKTQEERKNVTINDNDNNDKILRWRGHGEGGGGYEMPGGMPGMTTIS